ncbi:Glutathione-regulated potassium-efflux system protein kefC AltName: Full=K(+)/H(+) antiporter [Fibrisoma limi BUZ 3]|uniref:KefB protein n=1 Tax=Fibrisoma limi BUZ 3 TaxID=1185876 RepID=I2GIK0_9BACT|nr:monovalent cation:proton antiporter-2 (CPA2) family protein [Fibrisoma limi]CCH53725.1 Glutathione-regulated potassium-efflux system protein kefC AltName: Full=K(+)/H(+) antiporter [Fibrisoma limi BUZ 3]
MSQSVLLQAIVYLAAGVVFVPIAKRLGLGSVLGYLLAGMVIGPDGLGLVGDEGQDVMHVAEFGVVIMLFLIGLELEPDLLWKLRVPIVGLGGLQVVLTTVVVWGLAMLTGLPWQAALAVGMILAMSSTAIVLQTMNEKGLMQAASGQSTFSVLLFQDIAVIPILAILPLLATYPVADPAEGGAHDSLMAGLPGWLQTLAVLGAVLAVVMLGRFVMRPVFRVIAGTGLREVFIASALLLVGGVALLMESVGLSPALGAFVSGVVLANSEYKHELESDIDPFRGLLLGLFFISVGSSIDFGLIQENPLLVVGVVLGMMTLKAIVLAMLGRRFKLSTDQNLIFSLALSQVGEFAFVLLSFSLQNGILDTRTVGLLTAAVALSMALTPIVFLVNEKLLLPRIGTTAQDKKASDQFSASNPVIVAGFGRYGNIVGRFLRANGIGTTVLDFDSDRVDILRKIGIKVYYGDASRYDLLKSAGAEEAKVIIIALDSPEKSLELVETIKKHFPHLQILVRARDRDDAYEFMDAGIDHVYRETLDSSLRTGVDAMRLLGLRAYHAERSARLFRKHDEEALTELAAVRHDQKQYFSTARRRIRDLEQLISSDETDRWLREVEEGWDAESLRREANQQGY